MAPDWFPTLNSFLVWLILLIFGNSCKNICVTKLKIENPNVHVFMCVFLVLYSVLWWYSSTWQIADLWDCKCCEDKNTKLTDHNFTGIMYAWLQKVDTVVSKDMKIKVIQFDKCGLFNAWDKQPPLLCECDLGIPKELLRNLGWSSRIQVIQEPSKFFQGSPPFNEWERLSKLHENMKLRTLIFAKYL